MVLRAYGVAAAAAEEIASKNAWMTWGLLAGIGQEEFHHGVFCGGAVGADGTVIPPIISGALNGGVSADQVSDGTHTFSSRAARVSIRRSCMSNPSDLRC